LLNTILGSFSSGVVAAPSSYESIATITVGAGGLSTAEFTSIPSTYTHLQIRGIGQTNRGTYNIDGFSIQFNNDTATNYATHSVNSNGASGGSPTASSSTSNTSLAGIGIFGTSVGGYWGNTVFDILDYANTNKYKTVRNLSGTDTNGVVDSGFYGYIGLFSGLWMSTSSITSIKIFPQIGSSFNQYTQFALYGIKGA
jgi:hypothetical protein